MAHRHPVNRSRLFRREDLDAVLRKVNLVKRAVRFLKGEDGPTAVEYAVMLALIVVVCIAAITAIGTNANSTFSTVGSTLGTVAS